MSTAPDHTPLQEADQTPSLARGQMPFRDHLVELRKRMLYAAMGVGLAFFVAWAFHLELYTWVSAPVRGAMADNGLFAIRAMRITESISVYIKIALLGGFFLASPWVFYQAWAFVAPGLVAGERKFTVPVVGASVLFFVVGSAFCYVVVLPFMTDFLVKMTVEGPDVSLVPTLQDVVSYSIWLLLAFGLVFELPVFMYFLAVLQLVTARGLVAFYRYWIVISFVIGAVLTPTPDPINQALMSGPLVLLYGIGVCIAWVVEQDRNAGSRWSWRGASALVLLLSTSVLLGGAQIANMADRRVVDDLPLSARQLVAVRAGSLPRLMQQAGPSGRKALGPLALAWRLAGAPAAKSQVWIARFEEGSVAVIPREGALAVVRKISRARFASETNYAGGRSVLIRVPGSDKLWRVVAPDDATLWVGEDRAVGRLRSARAGQSPALGGDSRLLAIAELLRSQGPLYSLAASKDGIAGWLPAGALAGTVSLATAVVGPKAEAVGLRFECRGPEAAEALRNRLDAWAADTRQTAEPSAVDDPRDKATRALVGKLAELINKATTVVVRTHPADDQTLALLREVAADADAIAQQLQEPPAPIITRAAATPLQRAMAADAVVTADNDGPDLRWTIEVAADKAIDALFAPSQAGLDHALPIRRTKKTKPGKGKKKAGKVKEGAGAGAGAGAGD